MFLFGYISKLDIYLLQLTTAKINKIILLKNVENPILFKKKKTYGKIN